MHGFGSWLAAAVLAVPTFARGQGYPERPITLMVSYTAGGPSDITGRSLAEVATRVLGRRVNVDNRAGAGGTLGTTSMAQTAKGDGYTIAQTTVPVLRLPHMHRMAFNPVNDLTWIIAVAGYQFGVVVRADAPWKTWKEFVAHAKANTGRVSYGSPGYGTTLHVTMEEIARRDGLEWNHVPFKGTIDSVTALRGGHVMSVAGSVPWELVEAGTFRLLATWGEKRTARSPGVPTLKELGYDIVTNSPYGITGPKGMDPAVVKVLHDAFRTALDDPAYLAALERVGHEVVYMGSDEYARWARRQYEAERHIVERLGLNK